MSLIGAFVGRATGTRGRRGVALVAGGGCGCAPPEAGQRTSTSEADALDGGCSARPPLRARARRREPEPGARRVQ
jgi:hypothetical protein